MPNILKGKRQNYFWLNFTTVKEFTLAFYLYVANTQNYFKNNNFKMDELLQNIQKRNKRKKMPKF